MVRLVRYVPAAILIAIALAVVASGRLQDLSLESIEAQRAGWAATAAARPLFSFAVFVVSFAVLAGAGLPVAMMLTLVSGLVFGAVPGGLATAAGATAAALVTYVAARYALADWVQHRIPDGGRLDDMVRTLRVRGFWYLLSARLMPWLPFNLVNFACGVAKVPVGRYALATATGAVPTSMVYAGLGAGLGEGLSAGEVAAAFRSPTIYVSLAGMAALALLPVLFRRLYSKGSSSWKASS